jgi:mgtC family protein
MKDEHIDIESYEVKESPHADGTVLVVAVDIKMRGDRYEARIFDFIGRYEDINIDKIE